MDAAAPDRPPRRFIAAIILGAALIPINSTMIAVALPAIGETFQAGPDDLTLWLVSSYLLVNIVLLSPAGKLGDMLGRRRSFEIGLSLFVVAVLIAVLVPYLTAVAASRVLMAAGGAMLVPNAMALLRDVVSEHRHARVFGYFGAIMSASAAVGPLIGGVLTGQFGWQAIFLVNLPILLISWALVHGDPRARREPTDGKSSTVDFDLVGLGLLGLTLAGIVFGFRSGGLWPLAAIAGGVLGFFLFIRWERQASEPLVDLRLFRSPGFVIGGSLVGLLNLGMYALLFQLPFLLGEWYRLDSGGIGQLLLAMTLSMIFFSFLGGRLAEHIGPKNTILGGLVIGLGGMLLLVFTAGSQALAWMPIALACVGAGVGIVSGPSQAEALAPVAQGQSGAASGVLSTMRYLGGIAGITVVSAILTDTDGAALLTQSRLCFWIYTGFYLFALLLAFRLPSKTSGETAA
jgi:MFS family permease